MNHGTDEPSCTTVSYGQRYSTTVVMSLAPSAVRGAQMPSLLLPIALKYLHESLEPGGVKAWRSCGKTRLGQCGAVSNNESDSREMSKRLKTSTRT